MSHRCFDIDVDGMRVRIQGDPGMSREAEAALEEVARAVMKMVPDEIAAAAERPSHSFAPVPRRPSGAERYQHLAQWAGHVHIAISKILPGDTLADARHKRTNYIDILDYLDALPGYGLGAKANAYAILKRRVNALLHARMQGFRQEVTRAEN